MVYSREQIEDKKPNNKRHLFIVRDDKGEDSHIKNKSDAFYISLKPKL